MIALHCPTIVKRYEFAQQAGLEADQKERVFRYRDGLRSGNPIDIDEEAVLFLNHQQTVHSARYLYAANDTFDRAREALEEQPHLRSVTAHLTLGDMGRPSKRHSGMQSGTHLVVHGPADHRILTIEEIDPSGEGITARNGQIALLAQMASDQGMLRAELYVDGRPIRTLGAAMIEPFGNTADGWFRVVHRDASLRELGKRLDRNRLLPSFSGQQAADIERRAVGSKDRKPYAARRISSSTVALSPAAWSRNRDRESRRSV
ncbi:hypothetical protein [Bradyrhizobium sp. 170]|uniref:hypothetical protein n=1 Tax=Bradyrhizobium sp. 170 TaxID=2782641 RepID=UPI001FFF71B4|nr:hypothetical protein [Bradyrhizobium sp. 170]UPK05604.1 hypothetical protein IVB05_08170 [Bradyrhizobium sp. 170]